MVQVARIIGGAGTGKTTELMGLMSKCLSERFSDPWTTGFSTFTVAARREAAERAAAICDVSVVELERDGWFRTVHSTCFKQLGVSRDDMITGTKESAQWIANAIDGAYIVDTSIEDFIGGSMISVSSTEKSQEQVAIDCWHLCRNKLITLDEVLRRAEETGGMNIPTYKWARKKIEDYERCKRLDGRHDFVDLLGRFAGIYFHPDGHREVLPQGDVPDVRVWFFDEMQDSSPLIDAVCHRLAESATIAYLCLDPFQSIYGFAGSDATLAMKWDVVKEKTLPQSYRCPETIHQFGEKALKQCLDYFPRGIKSRGPGGVITQDSVDGFFSESNVDTIDMNQSWAMLARTNWNLKSFIVQLKERSIPWVPVRGNGGWLPSYRLKAIQCLWRLGVKRIPCTEVEWEAVTKTIPAKIGDVELLKRGTKTQWKKKEASNEELMTPDDVATFGGASPQLMEIIASGGWKELFQAEGMAISAHDFCYAAGRWGIETVRDPRVSVGTIHSVKGAEFDNVVLYTESSAKIANASSLSSEIIDEERRVAYVGITRARENLHIVSLPEGKQRSKIEIPNYP